MSEVILNTPRAKGLMKSRGLKQKWVIDRMGLRPTTGAMMLREGVLPKDPQVANQALGVLAQLLGVEADTLLLRHPARRTA